MDAYELDSIRRKKERQKLVQATIAPLMKLIMIVTTRFREQVLQIKEVQMQQKTPIEVDDYSSSDACSRPSKRQMIGKSSLGVTRNSDTFMVAMEGIKCHLGSIAKTMLKYDNHEALLATQKKMLLSKISMLQGVSEIDAIGATRFISRSPSKLDAFFSCPDDHWNKLYVQRIIVQLHGSASASQD